MERTVVVAALHAHPARLVLAVAGGGNALITDLLDVPGASRTVLEIVVPYSPAAMAAFVGRPAAEIVGVVSQRHATEMALAARRRARHLDPDADDSTLHGIAITAALVSDRTKRGDHRAHVAIAGSDGVVAVHVELAKGALDRAGEDRVVADAALALLAETFGLVTDPVDGDADRDGDRDGGAQR